MIVGVFFVWLNTVLGYATEEIAMRLGDVSATLSLFCYLFLFKQTITTCHDMTCHGMKG